MNAARLRTWAVGLAFLVIGTLGGFVVGRLAAGSLLLPAKLTGADVPHAPDLVGSALEDAREKAAGAGTELDVLGLAYTADADSGEIIFQYPPEGLPLEGEAPIEVLVSAGPGTRRVPDLVGLPRGSALALLRAAGIPVARVESVAEAGLEKGTVIRTEPPAGSALAAGDSVVVAVSRETAVVEVPDLRGKTLAEAGEILRGANLRVGETTLVGAGSSGETGAEAAVVGQDPPAGGLAHSGTAVELRLSDKPGGTTGRGGRD